MFKAMSALKRKKHDERQTDGKTMTAGIVRCNDEQKGPVSISLRTTTVEGGLKMTVQLTHSDTVDTVGTVDTQ